MLKFWCDKVVLNDLSQCSTQMTAVEMVARSSFATAQRFFAKNLGASMLNVQVSITFAEGEVIAHSTYAFEVPNA